MTLAQSKQYKATRFFIKKIGGGSHDEQPIGIINDSFEEYAVIILGKIFLL